jgi:hypothetical protein
MLSRRHLLASSLATLGLGLIAQRANAGEPFRILRAERADLADLGPLRQRAAAWLMAQQRLDGRLVPDERFAVGVTALGTLALLAPGGLAPDHPVVRNALGFLRAQRQPDGGFYDPREGHALYGTSLVLQAFSAAGETAGAEEGTTFLQRAQHRGDDCGEGGFATDASGVPDLHSTTAAIDGLVAGGISPEDPHLRAARRFVERCQDGFGGGLYSPDPRAAGGDHDSSGATAPAKPAAYGAMTHALIADLLVLGVGAKDPRIAAAVAWAGQTWSLDHHPGRPEGRGQEGLFGYYAALGKTCHLLQLATVARPDGTSIDWRGELATALRSRAQTQRLSDGRDGLYWRNGADRWGEAMPHLATCYALRCLAWISED